jgi:DNA-binding response OmpR family regulator
MKKILLIDDEPGIRSLLASELQEQGYDLSSAYDGIDAMKVLKNGERPNVVILDMKMPRMDGLETIGNVLKMKYNVPIIIYTAYKSYTKDYMSSAADAYIMKSPDLTELINKVHELAG